MQAKINSWKVAAAPTKMFYFPKCFPTALTFQAGEIASGTFITTCLLFSSKKWNFIARYNGVQNLLTHALLKREIMWILNLCQAGDWKHLKMVLLFSSKIHTAVFSLMWPPLDLPSETYRYWRLHLSFSPWPLCWGSQCTCMGIFSEMDTSCRDQTDNTELWSFSNNFERFLACVE